MSYASSANCMSSLSSMEGTVILPCHSQADEHINQSQGSISAVSQSEGSIHLGHVVVVPDVVGEETLGLQVGDSVRPNIDIIDKISIIDV